MRTLLASALAVWIISAPHVASAQDSAPVEPTDATPHVNEGLALGFDLHRFQDDFGFGGSVSTPSFAHESIKLTAAGGIAWFPHARAANGDETWVTYGHTRLVVEGGHRISGTPLRLYGVGGPVLLVLPGSLARDRVAVGGYGGFGFELFMPKDGRDGPVAYHIELGGIGTGARADAVAGAPIFANGFLVTVGMRFYP